MFKVTRQIHFCYGHRLLNYDGKCRYLHGHNGVVEVELEADRLDKRGMVFDFKDIKDVIQGWIDKNLDHRMILSEKDPVLPSLKKLKEPIYILEENPTAEAIAKLIYEVAISRKFPVTEVRLWETENSFATYHPRKRK